MTPIRTVLEPGRCRDCGADVVYQLAGPKHKGWLHPHGEYRCLPMRTWSDFHRRRYKARKEKERRGTR